MTTPAQRYQFKFADSQLDDAMNLAFNGLYSVQDAILSLANKAVLVATVAGGVITAVDVVSGGKYNSVPSVKAYGGGGSGSVFTPVLDRQSGAISNVNFTAGSGWTSPPALVVSGGQ